MDLATRIDIMLSTLNATDVGSLDSVVAKFEHVQTELRALEQIELAERAGDTIARLKQGDMAEFKRLRAFLQSRIGHLRP